MSYLYVAKPDGPVYHYTQKSYINKILSDGMIRCMDGRECWVCTSLNNIQEFMKLTIMNEGQKYIDEFGRTRRYPEFHAEDYGILELYPRYQKGTWVRWVDDDILTDPKVSDEVKQKYYKLSCLKIGYRGDLKFYPDVKVIAVTTLLDDSNRDNTEK